MVQQAVIDTKAHRESLKVSLVDKCRSIFRLIIKMDRGYKKQVNELVLSRLKKERREWRTDHPFGFVAKPTLNNDSTINMLKWHCEIPGPKETPWQIGTYTLIMDFSYEFPVRPPKCVFRPPLPHPNVYPSGTVCLSILNQEEDWKPHLTIKNILEGVQKLLREEPNVNSPAQQEPLTLYRNNREEYYRKVKAFALSQKKTLFEG